MAKSPMDKYRQAFDKAAKGVGKTGNTTMRNPKPAMGKAAKKNAAAKKKRGKK